MEPPAVSLLVCLALPSGKSLAISTLQNGVGAIYGHTDCTGQ